MKRVLFCFILFTLLILSVFLSCSSKSENGLEVRTLHLDGHKLTVELALSQEARQVGLMNRHELREDWGMLFVFTREAPRSFWMKNTYIPLSIAYINGQGIIVDIKDMNPLDTTPVPSSAPAKYALEVNRGLFEKWGIEEGYPISLPDDLLED